MKPSVFLALWMAGALSNLNGQGTLFFANRLSPTVFIRVTDLDGTTGLSGSNYFAQLFAGPTGSQESQLRAIDTPSPFRTGAAAGAWVGKVVVIPGVGPGEVAVLQVRVWDSHGGTLTNLADAVWLGALTMRSSLFASLPLGSLDPPLAPPNIVGNPDPFNNLQPLSGLAGYLVQLRFTRASLVAVGRVQLDCEASGFPEVRSFVLLRASNFGGPWSPDPAATFEMISTNTWPSPWLLRVTAATEPATQGFFRVGTAIP